MAKKYISWRRVSTFKQNRSGLGLSAQKEIIQYFVEREGGELIADYAECYTGKELSGCIELRRAMAHAKKEDAVLVIAKTDRFRNTVEALQIYEEMGDGRIMFCDLPHTDKFTLTLFFALAEREALIVSIRTKQALSVKKGQGFKLGAASPTYRENYNNKSQEEKDETSRKRARSKNERYLNNKNVRAFMRVLKNVFPDACKGEDFLKWKWYLIHNDGVYRARIINFLIDYNSMDGTGALFENWKFSEWIHDESRRVKMVSRILASVKKSIENYNKNN